MSSNLSTNVASNATDGSLNLVTYAMERDIAKKVMSIEDTLKLASAAKIKFVDVMNVSRAHELEEYISAIKSTGVGVYCYTAEISFLGNIDRLLNTLKMQLRIAAVLGAKLFLITPYSGAADERKAKSIGKEQVLQVMAQYFKIAVKEAAKYGLRVCFETADKDAFGLCSSADCKQVLDQTPGLGLVFNTANSVACGEDPKDAHDALKNYIVHVHLKDIKLAESDQKSPTQPLAPDGRVMQDAVIGSGIIPVREIYDSMIKAGYPGRFGICYSHADGKPYTLTQNSANLLQYLRWLK